MNDRLNQHDGRSRRARPINDVTARGLGWFSIGLGAAEILMPKVLARALGMQGRAGLLFVHGLREIATGIGILSAQRQTPWLWGRVAGDAIDLATLAAHSRPGNRLNIGIGMAAVAGVTALDVTMAQAMRERDDRRARSWVDYSDRSGFPSAPDQMRGRARNDFRVPRDMAAAPMAEAELALE